MYDIPRYAVLPSTISCGREEGISYLYWSYWSMREDWKFSSRLIRILDIGENSLSLKQFMKDITGHILNKMLSIMSGHVTNVKYEVLQR
jgi:hypothetical protein